MITRFYLPLLSTNVKLPKFGCHVTSLCQGLRRSAGSGGEDPENQVDLPLDTDEFLMRFYIHQPVNSINTGKITPSINPNVWVKHQF